MHKLETNLVHNTDGRGQNVCVTEVCELWGVLEGDDRCVVQKVT